MLARPWRLLGFRQRASPRPRGFAGNRSRAPGPIRPAVATDARPKCCLLGGQTSTAELPDAQGDDSAGPPPQVARKHHLPVTEDDYAKAVQNREHAVQNPAQQPGAQSRPKTEQGAVTGCGCDTLRNRPKSCNGKDLD